MDDAERMLERAGIKATSNRVLVLREILRSRRPVSLMDLDELLETLDKSSISRVLALLLGHGAVHAVEDGRGVVRYEPCRGHRHRGSDTDMHAHFYCERCRRVFCLENVPAPVVELPPGFTSRSVNFMVKGLCPECLTLTQS